MPFYSFYSSVTTYHTIPIITNKNRLSKKRKNAVMPDNEKISQSGININIFFKALFGTSCFHLNELFNRITQKHNSWFIVALLFFKLVKSLVKHYVQHVLK